MNLPSAFLTRMQEMLGEEYEAFLQSYESGHYQSLRLNPRKTDREEFMEKSPFHLTPVAWEKNGFYYSEEDTPGKHPYHEAGVYYIQEASAMAPVGYLDVQPGDYVLDLCAAPGGKSTQIGAAMQGKGILVCNEIHPARAKILSENVERMGLTNAVVTNESPERLSAYFPEYFDKILVDAPCSGEGMFRKEEAAVTDWTEDTNAICANRQLEILTSAAAMLRPGGRLVYSTCTFSPVENEGVISDFLWKNPDFSVEKPDVPFFSPGRPDWVANPAPGLEKTFRLWPHKLLGEGHYAAVLRRAGDEAPAALSPEPAAKCPPELAAFRGQTGAALPEGKLLRFGDVCYLVPQALPEVKGLRVLRAGLELGAVLKNRFAPAHAWALWLETLESSVSLEESDPLLARYLSGDVLPSDKRGWTLVQADGLSLGWAKGDGSQLKNHYPKALRRPV